MNQLCLKRDGVTVEYVNIEPESDLYRLVFAEAEELLKTASATSDTYDTVVTVLVRIERVR